MIDSVDNTLRLVDRLKPLVTDAIWIGKMQRVLKKLNAHVAGFEAARARIREEQGDAEIRRLVERLEGQAKIKWKDSIKAVLAKPAARN